MKKSFIFFVVILFISFISASNFNSTWNVLFYDLDITLPLEEGGIYNFTVDWGDGNTSIVTEWDSTNKTHTYSEEGDYNLSINGTIIGFRFNDVGDKLKILDISQWGDLNVGNNNSYFSGCSNLNVSANDILNLTGTTSLHGMFYRVTSFNGNVSNWNTSSVTDMGLMFYGAASFNQDLNNWDVSKVTDMSYIFAGATSFNGNISNWNTSSVTDMKGIFMGATSFNQDLNNWDVSKVTDMIDMFYGATSFNQDLNNWDTSSLIEIDDMFVRASSFNGNISTWDVSNIVDLSGVFEHANNFNQDLSNWNTSNVRGIGYLFANTNSFNGNISTWDVSNFSELNTIFNGAVSFNQPLNLWNTSKVEGLISTFAGATSFNQDLNNWDVSKVTDMSYTFNGATSFNGNISNWNTSSVTNMYSTFNRATSFNQDLNNWDVSKVTDMSHTFNGATSFNGNISNWNTSSVTDMSYMFNGLTLSTSNYNSLLIGWASLPYLQPGVTFNGGNSEYGIDANSSRQYIIDTYGWTISDGGLNTTGIFNITMIQPTENITINQNSFYKFIFNISCGNYNCGSINVSLDPVSGCDIANSDCTNTCGGLFSDSTSGWSYTASLLGSGIPVCQDSSVRYLTIGDTTCDSNLGAGSGDCAGQYAPDYSTYDLCPSYERKGSAVTSGDCVCNYDSCNAFDFTSEYFTGVASTTKSGLVSVTEGTTPFYTNASSNPQIISLGENESELVSFWVNATGEINTSHTFYGYIVPEAVSTFQLNSESINVTIIDASSDSTAPQITINSPTATTYTASNVSFNVTTNEASSCNYSIDNGATNRTMSSADSLNFINYSTLSNANYVANFYCEDSSGNLNMTENISFIVSVSSSSSTTTSSSSSKKSSNIFEVNPEFYEGNYIINEKSILYINISNKLYSDGNFSIKISESLKKYLIPARDSLVINKKSSEIVEFDINATDEVGVYVGKIEISYKNIRKYIEVVINVKPENKTSDILLNISKRLYFGENLTAKIEFTNLNKIENIKYKIVDFEGNILLEEDEFIEINNIEKTFDTSKLKADDYVFIVEIKGNNESSRFSIYDRDKLIIFPIILIIIIFILINFNLIKKIYNSY